ARPPRDGNLARSVYSRQRRVHMDLSPSQMALVFRTAGLCLLLGATLQAQAPNDRALSARVDGVVRAQMRDQHIPGVSVAVMRTGKIIKSAGYGFADLELQVPVAPEMLFKSGSLVKQFTAASIMMLVEEGKVGLDDKISKYLPQAPA